MFRLWRSHFLVIEIAIAFVLAGAVVWWSECADGWKYIDGQLEGNRQGIYGTVASVAGSLLGFVIAAFAIVVGSLGSRRMKPVEPHYGTLVRIFTITTVSLGGATLTSLLGLFLDRDESPLPWLVYLGSLFTLLSIGSVARSVWVLHNVVSIIGQPSKARNAVE